MRSPLRRSILALETLVFTVVVPGTVTVWIPRLILPSARLSFGSWTLLQYLALVPLGAGLAIYLRCLWEFAAKGHGIPAPIDHPTALVVSGLYRYVRNPMYLGVLLVLIGEICFFRSLDLLRYTVAWWVLVHVFVLFYEEPNLRRKFGPSYRDYTSAVRRWIPGRGLRTVERRCD